MLKFFALAEAVAAVLMPQAVAAVLVDLYIVHTIG
jgi:hypothetical protein